MPIASEIPAEVVIWLLILAGAFMLLLAIINRRFSSKGPAATVLTAMHDLQPRDKQQATQVVFEVKAGKKQFEQTNEEGDSTSLKKEQQGENELQ
ncbi:MAG: hypothetical protein KF749_15610 [Bacteroidetes bacterium]|nr:hypothetical protein [Bacteroidota bacterium]MCW5894019.1 hypothetical protein [Bacteroidota bacterium]